MNISSISNNHHEALYNTLQEYRNRSDNYSEESEKEGQKIQTDINSAQKVITSSSNILSNVESTMFKQLLVVNEENLEDLKAIGELDSTLKKSLSFRDYSEVSKLTKSEDILMYLTGKADKLLINKDKIVEIKQKHADALQGLTQAQSVHTQEAHMALMEIRRMIDVYSKMLAKYISTVKQIASSAIVA
ncbi:MAG: hypothetical protein KAH32_03435 [Chlamydiia bacterium]|nr:hypothetical protein [Chlamydiia bacterium]